MRIEGASGTPKKGFKIEKVKIHGVGPLSHIRTTSNADYILINI